MSNKRIQICLVRECSADSIKTPNRKFFKVPINAQRKEIWLNSIKRVDLLENKPMACYRVCEFHFDKTMFSAPNRLKKKDFPVVALPMIIDMPQESSNSIKENLSSQFPVLPKNSQNSGSLNEPCTSMQAKYASISTLHFGLRQNQESQIKDAWSQTDDFIGKLLEKKDHEIRVLKNRLGKKNKELKRLQNKKSPAYKRQFLNQIKTSFSKDFAILVEKLTCGSTVQHTES